MANNLIGISYSSNFNNLDGLSIIDADELYIDGKLVNTNDLVPYENATRTLNMGSQNIQTTHTATTVNDVVNLKTLQDAIQYVEQGASLTFLNKTIVTPQTVAGSVTFNGDDITLNSLVTSNNTIIANQLLQAKDFQILTSDGIGSWELTSSGTGAGGAYDLTVNNNQTSNTIIFRDTGKIEAKGYIDTDATASRVAIWDVNKTLDSSTITTTELGYLSGATSSIQTQINAKASTSYVDTQDALKVSKSGDTMTGTLNMGANKITSSYTPVNADDLCRKGYVDSVAGGGVSASGDNTFTGANTFTQAIVVADQYIQKSVITYTKTTDAEKWFKIASLTNTSTGIFRVNWSNSGNHGTVWLCVGQQFGSQPFIRIYDASAYGGYIANQFQLSVNNSDIYQPSFLEMYLPTASAWYSTSYNITVSLVAMSPQSTISIYQTKTDGQTTGHTSYRAYSDSVESINYSGYTYRYTTSGNIGVNVISPQNTLDIHRTTSNNRSGTHATGRAFYCTGDFGAYDTGAEFRHSNGTQGVGIGYAGIYTTGSAGNVSFTLSVKGVGNYDLLMGGTSRFFVNGDGACNVKGSSPYAVPNGYMAGGSLTIGGSQNYGGGSSWSSNTAGLLMECQDNTEIAIHDYGARLASFMYYSGNTFYVGRDMGWGLANTQIQGAFTINNAGDYLSTCKIISPWPSIFLDGTASTGRGWSILNGGNGAGIGQGNLGIFDYTANTYRFAIDQGGRFCFGNPNTLSSGYVSVAKMTMVDSGNGQWNHGTRPYGQGFCITQDNSYTRYSAGLNMSYSSDDYAWIVALAPGVAWKNLVLAGATVYFCHSGAVSAYTQPWGIQDVSDERCKREINDLNTKRSLEKILKCKPKYYKKVYPENAKTPVPDEIRDVVGVGLIAQEVQQFNPHCVSTWTDTSNKPADMEEKDYAGEERLGINYKDWTIHLIGAVQELTKTITTQQGMLNSQQEEIDQLKQKLIETEKMNNERFDKIGVILKTLMDNQ